MNGCEIPTSSPGLRDTDPAGARIWTYPARLPESGWAYVVDDFGLRYRRVGWWPFRRGDAATERAEVAEFRRRARLRCAADHVLGEHCGWASVRLAPDTEYCAGGQNYVGLSPDWSCAWKATARLGLHVRPQGMCAVVVDCEAEIDLRTMTWTVQRTHPGWPAELHDQADEKATKVVELLTDHVARRDAGYRTVPTAYNRWIGRAA